MAVINTNVKALFSQAALTTSGRAQQLAMQQLSTGKRINSARDDAAGMAIATRMTQQIRGLNQAVRNAGDAINLIQTAEGATNEITDMMQRMRELAVQAVNDTNDNVQRSYLDLEFQQLKQQPPLEHCSSVPPGSPIWSPTASPDGWRRRRSRCWRRPGYWRAHRQDWTRLDAGSGRHRPWWEWWRDWRRPGG